MPGTEWSPERHRRRALAAALVGHQGGDGYGNQTKRGRGGNGGGAHSGAVGMVSGLGDVLRAADRRRWWPEPEVEDDGDGDVAGLPGSRASCV